LIRVSNFVILVSRVPAVSVIVPTYKHRDYVLVTLDSVFAQSFNDFELIVVNDGSPDDTAAVLKPLADAGRIRYVEQPNAGQAAARNRGLELAGGEFVAFLDDDDLWPADKLEWQVAALREDGGVAIGGASRRLENGVLETVAETDNRRLISLRSLFGYNPFFSPGQVLIRTDVLRGLGGFDAAIWGSDDLDLWMRLAHAGDFWHVDRVALHYRLHATNASHAWERMIVNARKVFAKNVALLPERDRRTAIKVSQRWLYFYGGSERVQNVWSGRLGAAAKAVRHFVGPALRDGYLATAIVRDLVPRKLRRAIRPERISADAAKGRR
jgi:glycosyltransferase involved in cell wall biosynthesis